MRSGPANRNLEPTIPNAMAVSMSLSFAALVQVWRACTIAARVIRRGGRAVECTGLENRRPFTGFVGSNPTLSATCATLSCYHPGMEKELSKLKRRPFMFPLLLPFAVMAVAIMAAVWIWDMRATTVVIVVRHAEAEIGGDPDPNLSLLGRERAARLARVLAKVQLDHGVDAVFASEMRRTQQTVAPLAESLSLPINILPIAGWTDLPDRLLHEQRGKVVLVAGHSGTIPPLVQSLSGETVSIAEGEYDHLYIIFVPRLSRARLLQLYY
jgi:phosphohistidine phosphatase SixA